MTAWDRLTNRLERTMLAMEDQELPKRQQLALSAKSVAEHSLDARLSVEHADAIEKRLTIYRARAFVIADEGREREITTAIRRMHVHNPIPSAYGTWPTGAKTESITTDRIIEDPVFKQSHRSYFLQLADCVAFALLKREVPPTPLALKYGLHKMFDDTLPGVCFRKASITDPLGIVRK
jgi:hypothetical protein